MCLALSEDALLEDKKAAGRQRYGPRLGFLLEETKVSRGQDLIICKRYCVPAPVPQHLSFSQLMKLISWAMQLTTSARGNLGFSFMYKNSPGKYIIVVCLSLPVVSRDLFELSQIRTHSEPC